MVDGDGYSIEVRDYTVPVTGMDAATALVTRWMAGAGRMGREGEAYAVKYDAAQELLWAMGLTVGRDRRGAVVITEVTDERR